MRASAFKAVPDNWNFELYEPIACQLHRLTEIHHLHNPYVFVMLCTPELADLDFGAVMSALETLLQTKEGPLCYGLIYQAVRRICAERGLPDPESDETPRPANPWLAFPLTTTRIQ